MRWSSLALAVLLLVPAAGCLQGEQTAGGYALDLLSRVVGVDLRLDDRTHEVAPDHELGRATAYEGLKAVHAIHAGGQRIVVPDGPRPQALETREHLHLALEQGTELAFPELPEAGERAVDELHLLWGPPDPRLGGNVVTREAGTWRAWTTSYPVEDLRDLGVEVLHKLGRLGAGGCELEKARGVLEDETLYEAIPEDGGPARLNVTVHQPQAGLPFNNTTVEARFPGAELEAVVWEGPGREAGRTTSETFTLSRTDEGLRVSAQLEEDRTPEDVARLFQAFTLNVTDADESQVEAWTEPFLASRSERGFTAHPDDGPPRLVHRAYRLEVSTPARTQELAGALSLAEQSAATPLGVTLADGPWRFHLELPYKQVLPPERPADWHLLAGPNGVAWFTLTDEAPLTNQTLLDRLDEALDLLGLAPPPHADVAIERFASCPGGR